MTIDIRRVAEQDGAIYGPATCGCVALHRHMARYFTPHGKSADPAWPPCPHCLGLGQDRRLVVQRA